MNSNNTKSAAELHAEVRSELNNVNQGINRIQSRMTPGQIIDDAIFYPYGADPTATFEKLKLNPIGTTFLAMGTFLLMEDDYHQSYEATARIRGRETMGQIRAKTGSIKADAQGAIHNLKDSVQAKVDAVSSKVDAVQAKVAGAKQKVVDKVDQLKNKVHSSDQNETNVIRGVDDVVYDVGGVGISSTGPEQTGMVEKLKENFSGLSENISDGASNLRENFGDLKANVTEGVDRVREGARDINPMAFVGLGLGLGALTGAAIPMAESEHSLSGKISAPLGQFKQELQTALNQSINILKDEFFTQIKGKDFGIFKGVPPASESRI